MDIISDGIHVHPGFIGAFIKQKGIDQTILITDAMRAALMPEGEYDLGGQKVFVKDNSCKLEDGTLAGSVLTTGQALKNMVRFSDIPLERIIDMLTINPAKLLKLESVMGTLEEGKLANIVLLDESNNINSVYVKGICHFGGK
jgi:N-acetylglucosamine-6-phosphate deacetylase